MGRAKIGMDRRILESLYLVKRFSQVKIGSILGCSFSTIKNRLIEYGIPFRDPAEARVRYARRTFRGSLAEKAYMLGFAIGDLNVYKPSKRGVTLVVRCHSTQEVQLSVFKKCFSRYGKVTASHSSGHIHMAAYLDAGSFGFLLDKKSVPDWIVKNARWAFIAGYNDAEGNFILNQGRARMKIDSYDRRILQWIRRQLFFEGISCKLRKIALEGDLQTAEMKYRKDLWRLNVNEARSLSRLISILLPHTKHRKRKADMRMCLRNIHERTRSGTI